MRAGACAVQQTLTSEAASVLKHSLSLARRRGHAQVTPLHVAATLLSSRVSLLRRACLKSQPQHLQASHPLQCRALELCFNVALNRLPTTPGGPLLHGQPSLSNALIAALKRAQAHQRRGCIEQQQQQPLLAIKVELEQLVLSILDDPSVSRVMREAGFSSTAVKNNLEDCSVTSAFQCYNSSGGIYSTPSSPPSDSTTSRSELINPTSIWQYSPFLSYSCEQNPILFSPHKKLPSNFSTDSATYNIKEDIKLVVELLLRKKRRNAVIVSDSLFITQNLVAELMAKVEKGDVPEGLKLVHFIKFQFSAATLTLMKREEVEKYMSDLKREVENLVSGGRGVIVYTGDLTWTVGTLNEEENVCKVSCYSPLDHLVEEIGKLFSFYSSSDTRIWLLATANYQTYMRCQMRQPALDIQWALQAVSVPSSGGLGLSLNASSAHDTSMPLPQSKYQGLEEQPFLGKEEQNVFTCCPECTSNYEKELGFKSVQQKSSSIYSHSCSAKDTDKTSNELPHWLKPTGISVAEKDDSVHLERKWSKICQSIHQGKQNGDHVNHVFSNNLCTHRKNYPYNLHSWWPSYNSAFLDSKSISFSNASLMTKQSLNSVPRFKRQQSCHIEFNFCNGFSKYDQEEPNLHSLKQREDKEVKTTMALGSSAELKSNKGIEDSVICKFLQKNVPWQSELVPRIVEALLDSETMKRYTWLLFLGNDSIGKQKLALGVAESVFGSTDLLFDINFRKKDNMTGEYCDMLENALKNNDRLVVLLENIDSADPEFLKFLADSWRSGKIKPSGNKEENPCQAIFILTKLDATIYSDVRGKCDYVIHMKLLVNETNLCSGIFSSDHKRKAEWDFTDKSKNPRQGEMEKVFKFATENERKTGSNTLDLNMKAKEEENDCESEEFSPISSDLTTNDQENPLGFLGLINNRFVLNRDSTDESHTKELLLSKIKGSFGKVFGSKSKSCFTVEENILEKIFLASSSFLESLFEKWLKDVFETSLINIGTIEGVNIRLCLGSSGDQSDLMKEGFEGSRLPKNVQVMSFS